MDRKHTTRGGKKARERTGQQPELEEPLLSNRGNRGDEEEGDIIDAPEVDDSDDTANTTTEALFRKCRYRLTTMKVTTLDLLLTMAMVYKLKDCHPFVAFIVYLTLARTLLILFQVTRCKSYQSTKYVRYAALINFLFVIIMICSFASETSTIHGWQMSLFWILLIFSAVSSFLEFLCVLFLGLCSSTVQHDDPSDSTVGPDRYHRVPTAAEAAEGIAVGETKTIGLLELLKVLRPYFWPDGLINRCCVFLTWIFLITSKASNILAPLFIAKATDGLQSSETSATTRYIIAYVLLLLANKLFKEAQSLAYIRVKLIAGVQLQENVFSHLLSLSMDWHQRKSMGAVLTAMQRGILASNTVVQYLFLYLFPTLVEGVIVCIVFVIAFDSPKLAASAICGIILYIVLTVELTIWRMQFRKKMNKADNDASMKATDSLLNFETVKYFTAEQHEVTRYRESVDISQDNAYKIQGSLSMLNISQQIVLNATLLAALLVAASEYRQAPYKFTIGQFIAVNVYVIQLFSPLNFLGSIYGFAMGAYVDLQNLCNILAETPDIQDRENATTLLAIENEQNQHDNSDVVVSNTSNKKPLEIDFRDVSFSYPSRKEIPILKGISFTVPAGSTTAIVGETGSGKSTITRLLFRFYEADRGQVFVGGHDVLDLTQTSLRQNLGAVPQDPSLFNDTLEYNIRYGGVGMNQDSEAIQTATNFAQLGDFIASLTDGMKTKVGERGQQVSGGQKQRIAIARVLLKDPPVVVLDEATSSLDSRTEERIQQALFGGGQDAEEEGTSAKSIRRNVFKGRTVLVIAHRLSTIQHADQILVMSGGEILERGKHEALLAKGLWHEQCYSSLWDKQKKAE